MLLTGMGDKNVRYVMIDEVQDYTAAQLMVLRRYFGNAKFMMLGDEFQAIRQGTASFDKIRELFGEVAEFPLLTSYRSSPEITENSAAAAGEADPDRIGAETGNRAGEDGLCVQR